MAIPYRYMEIGPVNEQRGILDLDLRSNKFGYREFPEAVAGVD